MLRSAVEQYRTQQRITAAALSQLRRARFGSIENLTRTMIAYQVLAAREAVAAVPLMLEEQNLAAPLAARPRPESLAGYASDGRSMAGLLDYTRSSDVTDLTFSLIVATQLQDVARQAEAISIAARPAVTGYVRMLNTPSCSRCAILAGRFYRWSDGFERHPKCDCRHVPTTQSNARDLTTEPKDYFDSLPSADEVSQRYPNLNSKQRKEAGIYSQEDIFTKAGAESIRLGADPAQVVNARRGMGLAQDGTRFTTEGVQTRAGRGRMDLSGSDGLRLMPESIITRASGDRNEALRLLRANGYLE